MPTLYDPAAGAFETYSNEFIAAYPEQIAKLLTAPENAHYINSFKASYPFLIPLLETTQEAAQVKMAKKAAVTKKADKPLSAPEGFTFGADPELFIKNADGEFVCADMIPGTKGEPYKVEFGAVQRDGFAAEYNIDPCTTFEEWNKKHKAVQGQLQGMLPKGYTLVAAPAVRFSPANFEAAPDNAKELGCQPDWNAWDKRLNPPARPSSNDPYLRCAGGHIHFGWTDDADSQDVQHMMNVFDLTKQLDWYLGAWSVNHDTDKNRRTLYGRAGACRIKPYGAEYRVLSNFWVMEKELRLEVWNRMVTAVDKMASLFFPEHASPSYSDLVRMSINEGQIYSQLKTTFPNPILKLVA